jgi:hypothetical protein
MKKKESKNKRILENEITSKKFVKLHTEKVF